MPDEYTVREDGLQLGQHVAEDEAQFREIATIVGRLVEHLLLSLFEQFDRLLALSHQVVDEHTEMLVAVQLLHPVLVLAVDQSEPLIRVRQNVQDERRGVLQVHPLVLTQLDHLVHQLPGLVQHPLVGGEFRQCHRVGETAVELLQYRTYVHGSCTTAVSSRRHLDVRVHIPPTPGLPVLASR